MPITTGKERDELLTAIGTLLESRVGAGRSDEIVAAMRAHLDVAEPYLFGDVNPPRADRDGSWDEQRGAAFFPTENVGAVHLELGTFTTFPDERVRAYVENDGLAEFLRLDFDREYRPDLVADVTRLPLRSDSVDRVGSNSLMEHVAYPREVLAETLRVLRPGGVMEVATPFVWKRHGYPHDYVRLTPQYFERVCRELGFVDVDVDEDGSSGLYNTLHNAAKMAAVDHRGADADGYRALHEAIIFLLGALIPADRHFEDASRQWFHSVRVVARKPGDYQPSRRERRDGPLIERITDLLADPQSKAPLRRDRDRLICDFTGFWYAVESEIAVFTEPHQLAAPRIPARERLRRAAAGVARRRESR